MPKSSPKVSFSSRLSLVAGADRDEEAFGTEDARQRVEAVGQHRVRPQRRARATSEPTAIRSVAAATAPINANISIAGRRSTGAVAPEQVVVGEHAVEPRGLGRGRHRQ